MADEFEETLNDELDPTSDELSDELTDEEITDAEDTGEIDELDERTHKGYQKTIAALREEKRQQQALLQQLSEEVSKVRADFNEKLVSVKPAEKEVDFEDELEYDSEKRIYREVKSLKEELKSIKAENDMLKTTVSQSQFSNIVKDFTSTVDELKNQFGVEVDEATMEELSNEAVEIAKANQAMGKGVIPVKKAAEMAFKARFFDDIVKNGGKKAAPVPNKNKELLQGKKPSSVSSAQKTTGGDLSLTEALNQAYSEVYGKS